MGQFLYRIYRRYVHSNFCAKPLAMYWSWLLEVLPSERQFCCSSREIKVKRCTILSWFKVPRKLGLEGHNEWRRLNRFGYYWYALSYEGNPFWWDWGLHSCRLWEELNRCLRVSIFLVNRVLVQSRFFQTQRVWRRWSCQQELKSHSLQNHRKWINLESSKHP